MPAPTVDLIAIGPDTVCTGELREVDGSEWSLHLKNFVRGDFNALVAFSEGFQNSFLNDRYILANEIGDGRVLTDAPILTKSGTSYAVQCRVERFPRIMAQQLGRDYAQSSTTNDLFAKNGQWAQVSGVDALPQRVRSCLSTQHGESPFHRDFGARFTEYFDVHRNSPWFEHLLKLDVIRQAAIPYHDVILKRQYTPLQCVERVWSVELLAESPSNNRLPIRVEFEVNGVGRWQRDISVYVSSALSVAETGVAKHG